MTATTMHPITTASEPATIALDPSWMRRWLRAEGAATFAIGLAAFLWLGLPWYAFVVLLLVPDLSMVGYLRGPRIGAIVYNVAHDLATGVVVFGLGRRLGDRARRRPSGPSSSRTAGWIGVAGYGLKFPTAFGDTHLGHIGKGR